MQTVQVIADLGNAKEALPGARHNDPLIMFAYIKPPEVLAVSRDPTTGLGAKYGTAFDIFALGCMLIGMVVGLPCIETRDVSHRPADLRRACESIPPITPLLVAMLAEREESRPQAREVVSSLSAALKRV